MRDGRLERHEQAGLHHCQAHRYLGRGEALRERAEGAEGLDSGVGQGSALGGLYGELSESLQQRVELVMRFFLALGEFFDAPAEEEPQTRAPSAVPKTPEAGADDDTGISGMGRGWRNTRSYP